jgi:hypothetical protein
LEFAADSGAGRHLVSHEALAQQGVDSSVIQPFLGPSHESLCFHFSDANHFLLPGCPYVRSIGQDVADGMSFVDAR